MEHTAQQVLIFAGRACGLVGQNAAGENVAVLVDRVSGKIEEVFVGQEAVRRKREAEGSDWSVLVCDLLLPGFVDIHIHGLGGAEDAVNFWTNPGYSQERLPKLGTTSFLASLVFPDDNGKSLEETTKQLVPRIGKLGHGAVLEGIHAEGPFVHDLGALPKCDNRMSVDQLRSWIESMPPHSVRMMTISPRVDSEMNYARLRCLLEHSVLPALGHDRVASETDILGALNVAKPQRLHITHLFNVCNFHHRLPSLVNFGLAGRMPELPQYEGLQPPTIELIGDLEHVHALTLQATLGARKPEDVAFVTDAMLPPDPGKRTTYVGRELEVAADGKSVKLAGTDTLAGSCTSLLTTFQSLVNVLHVSENDASTMLSQTPARIVGLDHIGQVKAGCRADLLLLNNSLELEQTMIGGEVVYSANHV